jgi:hypothetical protein
MATIKLVDRSEAVTYEGPLGHFGFDVSLSKRQWTVYLPPIDEGTRRERELTEREAAVLEQVRRFLEARKLLGIFPRHVRFVRKQDQIVVDSAR